MNIYLLQRLYKKISNPYLRLAVIKSIRKSGMRYLMVRLDTNDVCNIHCIMCPFSNPGRKPIDKPMSIENFKNLADKLFCKTRYLSLSCAGEPLMTPNFDKLLDISSQYKIPFISYATNALLLNESFINATIRNNINEIVISVDGACKQTYESVRVGAKWEILNLRLKALIEAKRISKSKFPEIRFNYTVMKETYTEMVEFVHWVLQWEPSTIQFRLYYPRSVSVKQTDMENIRDGYFSGVSKIRNICESKKIVLLFDKQPQTEIRIQQKGTKRLVHGISRLDLTTLESKKLNIKVPPKVNCQLPWMSAYVHLDGDFYPCSVYPEPVGNIFQSSLEEIETSLQMEELKRSLIKSPKSLCVECQQMSSSGV